MARTPAARLHELMAELRALGLELEDLDRRRDALAVKRDDLLLEIRRIPGSPSLRDLGALAGVSHAWIRKLETRAG